MADSRPLSIPDAQLILTKHICGHLEDVALRTANPDRWVRILQRLLIMQAVIATRKEILTKSQKKKGDIIFFKYCFFVDAIKEYYPRLTTRSSSSGVSFLEQLTQSSICARSVEMDGSHCWNQFKDGQIAFKIFVAFSNSSTFSWDTFPTALEIKLNELQTSIKCPSRCASWQACFKIMFDSVDAIITVPLTKLPAKRKASATLEDEAPKRVVNEEPANIATSMVSVKLTANQIITIQCFSDCTILQVSSAHVAYAPRSTPHT